MMKLDFQQMPSQEEVPEDEAEEEGAVVLLAKEKAGKKGC